MDDARKFFRYVIPGLTFIIEVSFYFWLSDPERFGKIFCNLNKDYGFGLAVTLFIASGGLGFLLGIVYHSLYWSKCIKRRMVDHSPLLKSMVAEGWIRFK